MRNFTTHRVDDANNAAGFLLNIDMRKTSMLSIINFLTTIKIVAPSTVPNLTYHYIDPKPKTNDSAAPPDKSFFRMKLDGLIFPRVEGTYALGEIKLVMWYVGPTNPAEAIGSIPLSNYFCEVFVSTREGKVQTLEIEPKDEKTNSKLLSKLEAASQKGQNTCVFFQIYGLLEKTIRLVYLKPLILTKVTAFPTRK